MALSGFTMLLVTNLMTSMMVMTGLVGQGVMGCNEAVCASIVSKCMLLQSCKCELGPECTCCKVRLKLANVVANVDSYDFRDVSSAWTICTVSAAPVWTCVLNPMSPSTSFLKSPTLR